MEWGIEEEPTLAVKTGHGSGRRFFWAKNIKKKQRHAEPQTACRLLRIKSIICIIRLHVAYIYCRWDLPWDGPVLYDLVVISWLQKLSNPSNPFSMGKLRTFPMDHSRTFPRLRSPRFKSQSWGLLPFHVSMYTTIIYSITNIYSVTLGFVWILQAKLFEFDVENQLK